MWPSPSTCFIGAAAATADPHSLHDLETVAVRVAEREHRWHAFPVQQLPDHHVVGTQVFVHGGGIGGGEPDPGFNARGILVARGYQSDRCRGPPRRNRYPPAE